MAQASDNLTAARARLMSLASATKPPRILDVLRSLRAELVECVRAGHSAGAVLAALRAAGFTYSRSAFSEAWKAFRDENGLTLPKPVIYTPKGNVSRQQPAVPPRALHPPSVTRGVPPPPGSALEALARPSISELLSKS